MVLEATLFCLDNSEWMRNGDYIPSRLEAQHDAVSYLMGIKTNSNPENTVGLLTMAGKRPEVLVTLTSDVGKLLHALHSVTIHGESDVLAALQVAQLVLKHRQNKNQQQRIILFVGSPIQADKKELVKLAKRMKKNNVAVDIVSFGEDEQNADKLEAFIKAINRDDNSHLVKVPPGPTLLSEFLRSTPIGAGGVGGSGTAGGEGGGGGGGFDEYGGVDPSLDPELAMVLRMSLEEERQRQERTTGGGPEGGAKPEGGAATTSTQPTTGATTAPAGGDVEMSEADEEARLLQEALEMSLAAQPAPTPAPKPATALTTVEVDMLEATNEDEDDMALALQMSLQGMARGGGGTAPAASGGAGGENRAGTDMSDVMGDRSFIDQVLKSLPGVDPNDPNIRSLLAQLKPVPRDREKEKEQEQEKEKEKKEEQKK